MRRRWHIAAAATLVAVLVLAGCGGGGSGSGGDGAGAETPLPATPLPPVGPIPGAEFATVPAPTFEQVIAAYRTVTTANPALLNDEPALSRALFDEVRRTTTPASATRTRALRHATRQAALFDLRARLTLEEWKLVIRRPIDSARAAPTIEISAQAAVDNMPCEADISFVDGKADAFRHAYWNALMARRTTPAFAELFATAHETGSANAPAASAMDLHNNALGRQVAAQLASASEDELMQVLLQQSLTFVAAGAAVPAASQSLVYIAEQARSPLDGMFAGTLMQPDSGATPWALELHLSQCGAVVRGNYRATRAAASAARRFSGRLTSPTSMTLSIADPLADERDTGQGPCLGMAAELVGNERMWSGSWTSTNCPQGGTIGFAR